MNYSIFDNRLNAIIGYKFLHNFATGLISVFIPIYFAQAGLPIHQVFGIVLAQAVAFFIVALPVGFIVSKIGVNRSFLLSSAIYILLFLSVRFFPATVTLAVFAGVLNGLGMAFHWIPLNSEFTVGSEKESRSKDYGKLEGIPSLISPLAPLLGAVIMSSLGFYSLVGAAFLVVAFSALPLLANGTVQRPEIDLKASVEENDRFLWLLYTADGFASVPYVFVFPLFVYFLLGGTIETGIVKTLAGISSGLLALFFGYITQRTGRERILISATFGSALLCLLIPHLRNSYAAFILSFLLGIGYIAYTIPLVSMIADIGEERELLGFFSIREVFQNIGRIIIISFLVIGLKILPQSMAFRLTFYLNALSLTILGFLAVWIGRRKEVIF